MPALSSLYCGICWYFSNSAAQAAADSGGTMPVTGCHSVIDSPDRVSRVMPPITTISENHRAAEQQPIRDRPLAAFVRVRRVNCRSRKR